MTPEIAKWLGKNGLPITDIAWPPLEKCLEWLRIRGYSYHLSYEGEALEARPTCTAYAQDGSWDWNYDENGFAVEFFDTEAEAVHAAIVTVAETEIALAGDVAEHEHRWVVYADAVADQVLGRSDLRWASIPQFCATCGITAGKEQE